MLPDAGTMPQPGRQTGDTETGGYLFHPSVWRNLERRNEPDYLDALRKRQVWCEGTFAAQKWGHNLTRVLLRGLEAAEDHCLLSVPALNLKRILKCMG